MATILTDPAWLAVFIGLAGLGMSALLLLAAYPQIKKGAPEFYQDLRQIILAARNHADALINAIEGMADQELKLLQRAVYEWLDAISQAPVDVSERLLRRAIKLRRLIMGVAGRVLQIHVD